MADKKSPNNAEQADRLLYWGSSGEDPFSRYSNHFAVQITEHECFLTFFEYRPEMRVGDNPHPLRTGGARDVAEIVIPKHLFPVFLKILQDTYDRSKQADDKKTD